MFDAGETIYCHPQTGGPQSAIDVLAFVLARPEVILPGLPEDELEAAGELLDEVKASVIAQWHERDQVRLIN
ncbi:MAG: hypothetical protein IPL79_05660 [Myxococcales bacterium]|nr:hypothetical protein [Myxococcales bacterium]